MKWWYYIIIAIMVIIIGLAYVEFGRAQSDPQPQIPTDVQALQSQLAGAGCNAALNAAANEIIKLRKENAILQQEVAKNVPRGSGATKH